MRSRRDEFPDGVKRACWERAQGKCEECGVDHDAAGGVRFHVDHIVAAALGGKPVLDNARLLCPKCHRAKTSAHDVPKISKANRLDWKGKVR